MSRGIGRMQRRALLYLWQQTGGSTEEMPLAELRGAALGPERSNARRALRGLVERGLVEVVDQDGERRVALTAGASLALSH